MVPRKCELLRIPESERFRDFFVHISFLADGNRKLPMGRTRRLAGTSSRTSVLDCIIFVFLQVCRTRSYTSIWMLSTPPSSSVTVPNSGGVRSPWATTDRGVSWRRPVTRPGRSESVQRSPRCWPGDSVPT